MFNLIYLSFLIGFLILNYFFIKNLSFVASLLNIYDVPDNKRKFHLKKTPLVGGLIFVINFLYLFIFTLIFFDELNILNEFFDKNSLLVFYFGSFFFFFLGLCDDKYNLNPNIKISASILIALLVLSFDQKLLINFLNFSFNLKIYYLGTLTYFFTILSIILFINALNMIDGMNLQAGSYLFLITLYLLKINFNFYLLFFLILIIFFLYLNFQNRLFLGDNGIYLLGFVFSYFFIYYYNLKYIKYADNIFIIMMIPGIDLLRVFILRIINKKNPFSADRNHIHHYLLNYFSYKKSLFIFLILSSMPFVLSYLFSNNIFSAFFSLLIYFFLLIFLKIKKIKNYYKL